MKRKHKNKNAALPPWVYTGETFKYIVYPEPSSERVVSFDAYGVELYKQHGNYYVCLSGELRQVTAGTYNSVINSIAGMNDEAAADKIRIDYLQDRIKPLTDKKPGLRRKMYQRI